MRPIRRRSIELWLAFGVSTLLTCNITVHAQDPKFSLEVQAAYRIAANAHNTGDYGFAAEQWEAFLSEFPNASEVPKVQFYAGVCYIHLKRFQKGADAFAALIKKYPNSENIQDVYSRLGWCQYSLAEKNVEGMYAKAAATYSEMVTKFPEGKHTAEALWFWGESEYRQGNKKQAIAAYDQLAKDHPKSEFREDALYALGSTYQETGQYPEAGGVYDLFLKECPESEFVTEVRMRKAKTIRQAGDLAAAAKMFGEVAGVEGFALADNAIYDQASCLSEMGKYAEAGELYAKIATVYKQSEYAADSVLSAGMCFRKAERFEDATKWLQSAINAGGKRTIEAAHWLSLVYLKQNEPQKVLALTEQLLPGAADTQYLIELKLDRADALYEIDESKPQALDLYLKVAADHPQDDLAPTALYYAAFAARELDKCQDGLKHGGAFLQGYPDHDLAPHVKSVVAECYSGLKQDEEAEKVYRELVSSHPQHANVGAWQVRLGQTMSNQKKYQQVVETLTPLVSTVKNEHEKAYAQHLIGAGHYGLKQYEPAVAALRAALQTSPRWSKADWSLLLSRALFAQDNVDEAIEVIAKMISDFPESRCLDAAHYRYGLYSRVKGDYETAIAELNSVIKQWPDSRFVVDAQYQRGLAELDLKKHAEAIATFKHLLQQNPQHSLADQVLYQMAWAYKSIGDDPSETHAVETFSRLASDYPNSPHAADANLRIGNSHAEKGEFEEAVKAYTAAKEKDPGKDLGERLLYNLGWSHFQLKDYDAALADFDEQLKKYPQGSIHADAVFFKAECLFQLKNYEEALSAFKTVRGVKLSPPMNSLVALLHGGQAASKLEQWDEAIALLSEIPENHADSQALPDAFFEMAWAKQNSGREDEAMKDYAQAATEPNRAIGARARYMLGELYFKRKQYNEAIRQYKLVIYGYGGDDSTEDAKEWQAKAGYEAARCSEVQIQGAKPEDRGKLVADAKRFYQYVLQKHPQDDLVPTAKERLEVLSKL